MSRLITIIGEMAQPLYRGLVGRHCFNLTRLSAVKAWIALCLGTMLVSSPASASASEFRSAAAVTMSARIKITVVIPPIVQILDNKHPVELTFTGEKASRTSAVQHVVLISNLRNGICVELRLAQTQVGGWQIRLSGNASVRVEEMGDGYRLCTSSPGRYELALEHEFVLKDASPLMARADTALSWPVYVSLATP